MTKLSYDLLAGKDQTFSYAMTWNPSYCTTTNYVVTYGDGKATDLGYKLNADGYLTIDTTTNKFTIKSTTPVTKAGTYKIYVTGKTGVKKITIPEDSGKNKLTIELTLKDPCLTATTKFTAVADQTYKVSSSKLSFTWAKPTITPTACNDGVQIKYSADYTSTIPVKIAAAVKKVNNAGTNTGWKYEVSTSDDKLVGTYSIVVAAKYKTTVLKTALTIKLSITEPCDSATVTKVTPSATKW